MFEEDSSYNARVVRLRQMVAAVTSDPHKLKFQFANWRRAILKVLFDYSYLRTVVFGCPK